MRVEPCTVEAEEMAHAAEKAKQADPSPPESHTVSPEGEEVPLMVWDAFATGPSIHETFNHDNSLMLFIKNNYVKDKVFNKIIMNLSHYKSFQVRDGYIYTKNWNNEEVLCVPWTMFDKRTTTQIFIDHAHMMLRHFRAQKTSEYLRHWVWWPQMGTEVEKFCISCMKCQVSKPHNQLKVGLLHSLPLAVTPWNSVMMDFVGPFPRMNGYDYLWVIVCRCTSMVHLIPIQTTNTAADLALNYFREIVRLHGLPKSTVSD